MGCTPGEAFVSALERECALALIEIGLIRLIPSRSAQRQRRRPADGEARRIYEAFRIAHGRWKGTLRHFGDSLIEALHILIEVRLHPGAGLENDDFNPLLTELIGNKRPGKSGSNNRDIAL